MRDTEEQCRGMQRVADEPRCTTEGYKMLKTKLYRADTKVLDAKKGQVSAVVSTESPDRDGDIVRVNGWDFDNFNKHPVLLADHNYRSIRAQIGEWEDMKAIKGRSPRVEGVARYYVNEGNEVADWAFNLAEKNRAAYSVGFIPDLDKAKPIEGKGDDEFFFFGPMEYNGQELLEVSHVTIPANAEALQRMKGLAMHPVLQEVVDEVLKDEPEDDTDLERLIGDMEKRLTRRIDSLVKLIEGLQAPKQQVQRDYARILDSAIREAINGRS